MPTDERATPDELDHRIDVIRSLHDKGMTQAEIVRYAGEKLADWNITERQIRRYYAEMYRRFTEEAVGVDRAALFTRELSRLNYLYGQAVKVSDHKTALQCVVATIKLLRLDAPNAKMDWKEAAKKAGVDADNLYKQLFASISEVAVGEEDTDDTD